MTTNTRGSIGWALLPVGRLALAGIFLFAAYAKLKPQASMGWSMASAKTSLSMFAMQVDSYQLLPPQLVSPMAHFLPLFELFLGLWLLRGILFRYSALWCGPIGWAWKLIADVLVRASGWVWVLCCATVRCWRWPSR